MQHSLNSIFKRVQKQPNTFSCSRTESPKSPERSLALMLPKNIPINQLTEKNDSVLLLYLGRSCSLWVRKLSWLSGWTRRKSLKRPVFLFCQGHCLQWRHKGKNEDIHWVKILHKLFPSWNHCPEPHFPKHHSILLWYLLILNQSFFAFMNFLPR